jgi:hypothetical protein
MKQTLTTWRVISSQQDMARKNARQALLVIQQRRREQAESEAFLPLRLRESPRSVAGRSGT